MKEVKKVLYNFKGLQLKGIPYEDLNINQIKELLKKYNIIINSNNEKFKDIKEITINHYDYLISLYGGLIVSQIESLAAEYNLDSTSNMLSFDFLFKNRGKNKGKKSFLDFLAPTTDMYSSKTLSYQLGLEIVINSMIKKIRDNNEEYIKGVKEIQKIAS